MPTQTQTTVYTAATPDGGSAARTQFNKTFYHKTLLEYAKTNFVHAKYGQKQSIPKNGGKTVEFRKWDLFDPTVATHTLSEGVTPTGLDMSQTKVEATVAQYGAFVRVSDLLELSAYDRVIDDNAELLGELIGHVIEKVTVDELNSGGTAQYATTSAVTPTSRLTVTGACVLTVAEIRKAVRTLKKNKARPFRKGRKPHYICICGPDAVYDLQGDSAWVNVSSYSDREQIYDGELGKLFGVVFVESTETKVFAPSVVNAVSETTTTSANFVLKNDPTAAEIAYLSTGGNKLYINGSEVTLASSGSYTAATKTVKLSSAASLTADHLIYSQDAGALDSSSKKCGNVYTSLVFGADAYGTVDIEEQGGVQLIIKPKGSSGTEDPLNQRSTIGAKATAFAAKVLNDAWIIRIEHAVSA